jgi:hypothetical protein
MSDCSKSYAAPDGLVGRRIRCRNCSTVFTVTPAMASPAATGDGMEVDLQSFEMVAPSGGESLYGRKATAAGAASIRRPDDADDPDQVFSTAFKAFKPATRPNYSYKFPNARLLDQVLPWALTGIGAIWLLVTIFSTAPASPAWVAWLRLFVLFGLFACVIFPITAFATYKAARTLKFDLPPGPRWRVFGTFAFPFALATVMWLTSGGANGLIVGGLFGTAIGLGVLWLLLRLEPAEAPAALGMVGTALAVSAALAVGIVLGLNAIAAAADADKSGSHTLASSPIGPGLAWAPPRAADPVTKLATPTTNAPPAGTAIASIGTDVTPVPSPSSPVSPASPAPGGSIFTGSRASPATVPAVAQVPWPVPQTPASPPVATPAAPRDPPPSPNVLREVPVDGFIAKMRAARSPLVAAVEPVPIGKQIENVVHPLTPSAMALVLTQPATASDEEPEVWSLAARLRLSRRPPFRVGPSRAYAISPSGEFTFRLVSFPRLSVEVWSGELGAVTKLVPLPAREPRADGTVNTRAMLLGALDDHRLLVRWDGTSAVELEVFDVNRGTATKPIVLPEHVAGPGNGAVSPDGRQLAMIGTAKGKPALVLFTLTTAGGAPAQLSIAGVDPQWVTKPAAMQFSPDGKRLAILFAHADLGMIHIARVPDGKMLSQHLIPSGMLRPMAEGGSSFPAADAARPGNWQQLSWIGNGGSLLVRGDLVLDRDTGQPLGRLGADEIYDQWVQGTTAILHYRHEGTIRLAHVQLVDPKAAAAAPAPPPTPALAAAPATRPATKPAVPTPAAPGRAKVADTRLPDR